jgi:hypothetical protein
MSSLGPKARALIRCNRKNFEVANQIANQASPLKWLEMAEGQWGSTSSSA